jgi:hypothetical protein
MRGPTSIGLVLLAAGAAIYFFTPHHVTWGNHHYLRQWISYGLMGVGALFVLVGSRRR